MRIRVKPSTRRLSRIVMPLASLIDITFLLLIYFMVTTVLARHEDRLSSTLQTEQGESGAATADFQRQIVEVKVADGEPGYQLGGTMVRTKADLIEMLRPLHKPSGVFVRVADEVPVGFAVAALQAAHDAGFEQVTYVPGR